MQDPKLLRRLAREAPQATFAAIDSFLSMPTS
jgi:hypothetical protein